MAAEVVRIPTAPHTPANEWANDTAMTLRSTINNNTLPNDTLPNNTLASNPLSNHPLPNTLSSEATSMNSTLAQPPTPGINPSVASTPGRELPGGWGAAAKAEAQTPPHSTTIYDDISNALSTVGQTAFNMIPNSLKSSVSSAHPSETPKGPTGGVGDLPGPAGEAGVAQLPLEREAGNKEPGTIEPQSTTLQTLTDNTNAALESTTTGLSKAADTMTEQARGAFAGGEKPKTESSANAVPPTTVPTTFGEGAGVGDLPGDAGETSVMKLPLEREAEKKTSTGMNASSNFLNESSESDSQPRKELVSAKVEPEKSTAAAFIDRRVPTPDPDTQPNGPRLVPDPTLDEHAPSAAVPSGVPEHLTAQRISGDRDVKEAASRSGNLDKFNVSHVDPYGQQRQDAHAPSPPPKDDSSAKGRTSSEGSGTRFTEQVHPPPEHQLGDHGHGHNRSASTSSTGSKIRFRDKIKGEIKVLSGKVTKNEAKVEEGKAILAGEKA